MTSWFIHGGREIEERLYMSPIHHVKILNVHVKIRNIFPPKPDDRPGSVPALELISRAMSSVGVMYRSHHPNTRSNPGGGQMPKKKD